MSFSQYIIQLGGNKSKILRGLIKFSGTGDHYPEDLDVPKASAWQSWEELGGWKCAAAGDKWILNTSLHGVTLSTPFSMPLSLPSLSCFPLLFLLFPKRHAGGKRLLVSMATNRLSNEVNRHKGWREKGNKDDKEEGLWGGYFSLQLGDPKLASFHAKCFGPLKQKALM